MNGRERSEATAAVKPVRADGEGRPSRVRESDCGRLPTLSSAELFSEGCVEATIIDGPPDFGAAFPSVPAPRRVSGVCDRPRRAPMRRSPSEQRLLAVASPPVTFVEARELEAWEPTLASVTEVFRAASVEAGHPAAPPRPLSTPPRGTLSPVGASQRVTALPQLPRGPVAPRLRQATPPAPPPETPRERAVRAVLWSHSLLAVTASLYYGYGFLRQLLD